MTHGGDMYYPLGRYTELFVHEHLQCMCTSRKDALSFRKKEEAEQWLSMFSIRKEFFTITYLKEKRKVKSRRKSNAK